MDANASGPQTAGGPSTHARGAGASTTGSVVTRTPAAATEAAARAMVRRARVLVVRVTVAATSTALTMRSHAAWTRRKRAAKAELGRSVAAESREGDVLGAVELHRHGVFLSVVEAENAAGVKMFPACGR